MAKKPEPHASLSVIREDLETLKADMVEDGAKLISDIKEQSMLATKDVKKITREQIKELRTQLEDLEEAAGRGLHDGLAKVEKRVKSRPMESIAIAFGAGILASILMGRRD